MTEPRIQFSPVYAAQNAAQYAAQSSKRGSHPKIERRRRCSTDRPRTSAPPGLQAFLAVEPTHPRIPGTEAPKMPWGRGATRKKHFFRFSTPLSPPPHVAKTRLTIDPMRRKRPRIHPPCRPRIPPLLPDRAVARPEKGGPKSNMGVWITTLQPHMGVWITPLLSNMGGWKSTLNPHMGGPNPAKNRIRVKMVSLSGSPI